jgi:hypothetical protein
MCGRIFILPALEKLEELLRSPLLKDTHERAPDSLHLCAWHFRDLAVAVHEAARNLLELKVTSDIRVNEDLGELARRDNELGHEINRIVAVPAEVRWRLLGGTELTVQLRVMDRQLRVVPYHVHILG